MNTKPLKLRLLASEIAHIANIAMREDNEQSLGQAIAAGVAVAAERGISDSRGIVPCAEHSGDQVLCLTYGVHHLAIDADYVAAAKQHREEALGFTAPNMRVAAGPSGLHLTD